MKLRWSPKAKVAVVMVVALLLPIAAIFATYLVRLYYFKQTKPFHAIVNQQLLMVMRNVERQIVSEKERLGRELAMAVEPGESLGREEIERRLTRLIHEKPFTDLVVYYHPDTGVVTVPKPAPADSFEARELSDNADLLESSLSSTYDRMVPMLQDGERQHLYVGVFDYLVVLKRDRHQYNTAHYVLIHDAHGQPSGILGFTIDRDYMQKVVFPTAYRKVPVSESENPLKDISIVYVRDRETGEVVWTSEPYEGKEYDSRKPFDGAVFFGTLYVKLKGKSIDAIAGEFLYQNLAVAGVMAVVLCGGLFFTWRSVNREIELARLKSDFVSNVSHELKTPLALIRLFAETLEMGRVRGPEKMQEYYATIRKESERLTGLINNLLDFSRIEAGGKQYRFEKTDVAGLVSQAIETCRYQFDQQGFELDEQIAPGIPEVQVDPEAYSLCVLNLLDNAMKYSGQSRKLGVKLDRENGCVRLEVRDEGIGISRKDQERIFEKFYRAGDPLIHDTKGSGLGLSLVRHVAQAHHGTVTVESAPGQGSKFTLKVPIDDASRN